MQRTTITIVILALIGTMAVAQTAGEPVGRTVIEKLTLDPSQADCEGSGWVFFRPQPIGGPWKSLTFGWDASASGGGSNPSLGFTVEEWVDLAACSDSCNCGGTVGTLTPLAAGPWQTHANISSQGGKIVVFGNGVKLRVHGQGPTRLYLKWER